MIDKFLSRAPKAMEKAFAEAIKNGVFPGAVAAVFQGSGVSRRGLIVCHGKTSYRLDKQEEVTKKTFYDLASLTKPLATLPALLCLMAEGKIKLEDGLSDLLQREVPWAKRSIRLKNILSHSSGFPAYLPFFSRIKQADSATVKRDIVDHILTEPLLYSPGTKTLYSDLGFILAGSIVEIQSGQSLAEFVREKVYQPLGLSEKLFFNWSGASRLGVYAVGEYCPWRNCLVVGEVSDENAALLGGVAGHAGLFGNIEGVLAILCYLVDLWQGQEGGDLAAKTIIKSEDLSRCFRRQKNREGGTWALGVDTPCPKHSSSGRFLSPTSIGHLGFTGTSFWYDPERQLLMILLTNRVHPCRSNNKIKIFRPFFHDLCVMELCGENEKFATLAERPR